ncbi:MAG: aminotransferase class V-fold PLP-dependent enzyme [Neisseriaceae bacterium]|nr:aminotransferase class V-fold PLP-dependent enzyme [Neisseriaceae bacterium]
MSHTLTGRLIAPSIHQALRAKFAYLERDMDGSRRLFFDNSGGSLRLIEAIMAKNDIDLLPDCPEREHERARMLQDIMAKGQDDILRIMLNAPSGSLLTELTASQVMFQMMGTIVENVAGTNVVTSNIEHPSAYDAAAYYCAKTGKTLRVAEANAEGFVSVESILDLIDEDTTLLSIIASSNISGNIMDLATIVAKAREKKPGLFIISDAVQHLPHGTIDLSAIPLDGLNFAPYKFMASRGIGFGYVSDRVSALPHHKLLARPDEAWGLGTPTASLFHSMSQVFAYVDWLGASVDATATTARARYLAGMEAIELHERALLHRLLNGSDAIVGLRQMAGVNVYVDAAPLNQRDLIVAMGIEGWDFDALRAEYQRCGVTVYERVNTSIYSKRIVEALGLSGAIRVSPMHCHHVDEIDQFLRITQEIALRGQ